MNDRFEGVTVLFKANIYHQGRVQSRTILFPDGSRKTLGVYLPGEYSFHADAEETLDITAGTCSVLLEGEATWRTYGPGATFVLPGNRSFRFRCEEPVEYICGYAS